MSLSISATTRLSPREAVEHAARFFGQELGLTTVWRSATSVRFEGGGGHVQVQARPGGKGAEVDLETMEWEIQAREFVGSLPR